MFRRIDSKYQSKAISMIIIGRISKQSHRGICCILYMHDDYIRASDTFNGPRQRVFRILNIGRTEPSWTFLHSVNTISAINFPFRNDRENSKSFRFKRWRGEGRRGGEQRQETGRKRETECNELCMKASIRGLSEHSP